MVEKKNRRTKVESWGTGHKDFTAPPPGPKEKRILILGIAFGAVLSIIGNIMVTVLFRIIDKGFSIENGFYLITSFIIFIAFLFLIYKIFEKIQ